MAVQWSLVCFTVLAGLACWCFVGLAVDQLCTKATKAALPASIVSLAALALGGIASVTHLSHPARLVEALSVPTSSIFMEGVGTLALGVLIIIFIVLAKRGSSASKYVAAVGAVVAIVLSFVMGNSYVMASRDAWNTLALPFAYLGTAMALGVSAYAAVAALTDGEQHEFHSLLVVGAAVISLVTVVAYAVSAGVASYAAAAPLLWGGTALVGGVVPAVCGVLARKDAGRARALLVVAAICALIGAITFRMAMWEVGSFAIDYFGAL